MPQPLLADLDGEGYGRTLAPLMKAGIADLEQLAAMKPGAVLLDANGAEIDPWRVQAGTLCRIVDLVPASPGANTLAWNNSFRIQGTAWDEDSQTLTLTPETQSVTTDEVLAAIDEELRGNPRRLEAGTGKPWKADFDRAVEDLDELLTRAGVDARTASVAEVKAAKVLMVLFN